MKSCLFLQVHDPDSGVAIRSLVLTWPGEVVDLELPASGFHHVNGTNRFYLYERLTGKGMILCTWTFGLYGTLAIITSMYIF